MSTFLLSNQNIISKSLNTGGVTLGSIVLSSASMQNLSCSSATIPNVIHTTLTSGELVLTNSSISNLLYTNTSISNLLVSGNIFSPQGAGFGTIKTLRVRNEIADNTASVLCTITTPTNESGGYTVLLWGSIGHALVSGRSSTAVNFIQASFNRSMNSTGAGTTSTIEQTVGTSIATSSAVRDIGTITLSTTEVTEYVVDVSLTVDVTGSGSDTWYSVTNILLMYHGFTNNPTIA